MRRRVLKRWTTKCGDRSSVRLYVVARGPIAVSHVQTRLFHRPQAENSTSNLGPARRGRGFMMRFIYRLHVFMFKSNHLSLAFYRSTVTLPQVSTLQSPTNPNSISDGRVWLAVASRSGTGDVWRDETATARDERLLNACLATRHRPGTGPCKLGKRHIFLTLARCSAAHTLPKFAPQLDESLPLPLRFQRAKMADAAAERRRVKHAQRPDSPCALPPLR